MHSKLKFPLRTQFLFIAISLVLTSSILALSAYLTDSDEYSSTFHIASGNDLGFTITGYEYEDYDIDLGETIELNAKAEIAGRHEVYVFVKIDSPSDFVLNGFSSDYWKPISEGSTVYYYGTTSQLVPLGGENGSSVNIIDSITLSDTAESETGYTITITGYAIQASAVESGSTPSAVFDMCGDH